MSHQTVHRFDKKKPKPGRLFTVIVYMVFAYGAFSILRDSYSLIIQWLQWSVGA